MKPSVLAKSVADQKMTDVNFKDLENQVNNDDLVIGIITKQLVHKLLDDGDIIVNQLKEFYIAFRAFYVRARDYLLKWCPLQDKLLVHATWIDLEHRLEQNFSSVEYFIGLYPNIFVDMNMEKLHEQFIRYQLLVTEDIFQAVCEKCGLQNEDDVHRIDDLWSYLATLKTPGSNDMKFDLLAKVAGVL